MRRTILFIVVAVIAVMVLPGLGIGQPVAGHGGTPSDVFMQTVGGADTCMTTNEDGRNGMPQELELADTSHVLAYFTFQWRGIDRGEYGQLQLELDGPSQTYADSYRYVSRAIQPSETVMWSFPGVTAGSHTVSVYAAVDQFGPGPNPRLHAVIENCALTVLVMPVAA